MFGNNIVKRLGQSLGLSIPLITGCASSPDESSWQPNLSGSVTLVNRYNAKGILAVDEPSLQLGLNGSLSHQDLTFKAGAWSSSKISDLTSAPQEVDYSAGIDWNTDLATLSFGYTRLSYPDGSLGEDGDSLDFGVSGALGDLRANLAAKYLFEGDTHSAGTRYNIDLSHPIIKKDDLLSFRLSGAAFDDFYVNGQQLQLGLGGRVKSLHWGASWQKGWGDLRDQFLFSIGHKF